MWQIKNSTVGSTVFLMKGKEMTKEEKYLEAKKELLRRTENESDLIANLSNASAILNEYMDEINWVGFYLLKNGQLVLGPFQGRAACVRINQGSGVCGTAFERNEVLVVPDVHKFPGHIACDDRSRSEIVIPVHYNGRKVGVLDIDSPVLERFDEMDKKYLCDIAGILEVSCRW